MSEQKYPIILHISDLHFGWDGDSEQSLIYRKVSLEQHLIRALRNLDPEWRPGLVCITGDLAGKGLPLDYVLAGRWLDELTSQLDIQKDAIVICPGNHDVDRNRPFPGKRPQKYARADTELRVPINADYAQRFQAFVDWCGEWGVTPLAFHGAESYLVGSRSVMGIRFVVLNSAWFSRDKYDDGKMWLGWPHAICMESEGYLPNWEDMESSPITVTMFHHPKSSLNSAELQPSRDSQRPSVFDYVCNRCHVMLTGHAHLRARPPDVLMGRTVHIQAGATYEAISYHNSVGLIRLGEDSLLYWSLEFNPSSDRNGWETRGDPQRFTINRKPEQLLGEPETMIAPQHASDFPRSEECRGIEGPLVHVSGEDEDTDVCILQESTTLPQIDEPAAPVPQLAELPDPAEETRATTVLDTVASRVDSDLSDIKRLRVSLEFTSAIQVAHRLDAFLAENRERVPPRLASETYYVLYTLEVEHAHYRSNSDLTKAKHYLSQALLYGGEA